MSDLKEQLQATLSGAYTLERELGGGGMSRVFVADEIRLGRKVVVKVLSPELAAGISAERFEREIRMAASLQQANIVPVLSTGDTNGLPYYTMPFVEGESLRRRLSQQPPLPISDTLRILGDVARAPSRICPSSSSCGRTPTPSCSRPWPMRSDAWSGSRPAGRASADD